MDDLTKNQATGMKIHKIYLNEKAITIYTGKQKMESIQTWFSLPSLIIDYNLVKTHTSRSSTNFDSEIHGIEFGSHRPPS